MTALLLFTLVTLTAQSSPSQQPPTSQPPPTQAPKTPAPQAPRPSGSATTTALLFITDNSGSAIEGVTVTVMGPVDREVKSPLSGPTRIAGLRAGTYRVRFTREGFITFEKELVWRAGTVAPEQSVVLNRAPAPPPPAPVAVPAPVAPPAAPAPKLPPPGIAKTMSLPDYIEKNFISTREPRKENIVGCSGVGQALLWQIREPWDGRRHESADVMLYVIGGEGSVRLDGREMTLNAGGFAVVPRGTQYGLSRRGRNPLIVLAVLSGAPCAAD